MPTLSEYLDRIEDKNLILSFHGNLTNETISSLIETAEDKIQEHETNLKNRKKVIYVVIESIQNIFHHQTPLQENGSQNCDVQFTVYRIPEGYKIITANYISNSSIEKLEKRITETNALSNEQVREYYIRQLDEGEISSKGGAGLGLIDIFRKTGEKLNYWFEKINNETSLFCLEVTINTT
jgi:hypothetical protein